MEGCHEPFGRTTQAFFIKLGGKGAWEADSLEQGTIRFGYRATPHELCLAGDWRGVQSLLEQKHKPSVASNHLRQIRTFYTAGPDDLFITFHGGYLWWARPDGKAKLLEDHSKVRGTVDGWRKTSVGGSPLLLSKLSGTLLKTRMFQGTICAVQALEYLLRKLSDRELPQVAALDAGRSTMASATVDAVRLLADKDFELLIELIFASSGWRRLGATGGNEKTVDMDLVLPTTGERAFVQVKSETDAKTYQTYEDVLRSTDAYSRMFFVWHTGDIGPVTNEAVTLWGPNVVANMIIEAGLVSWVRSKVG